MIASRVTRQDITLDEEREVEVTDSLPAMPDWLVQILSGLGAAGLVSVGTFRVRVVCGKKCATKCSGRYDRLSLD